MNQRRIRRRVKETEKEREKEEIIERQNKDRETKER